MAWKSLRAGRSQSSSVLNVIHRWPRFRRQSAIRNKRRLRASVIEGVEAPPQSVRRVETKPPLTVPAWKPHSFANHPSRSLVNSTNSFAFAKPTPTWQRDSRVAAWPVSTNPIRWFEASCLRCLRDTYRVANWSEFIDDTVHGWDGLLP